MKIKYLFIITGVILLTLHIVAGGLAGSQSQQPKQQLVLDEAMTAVSIQDTLAADPKKEYDGAITSKSTIITLIFAVMGIVAFRRNTYS